MATMILLVVLSLLVTGGWSERVLSAVVFVLYGDRTPLVSTTPPTLTPLGAQQLFDQGSAFRARYLDGPVEDLVSKVAYFPIEKLEPLAIDNSQLTIWANSNSYTAASAMAFLQGLYPPVTQAIAPGGGGINAARLSNGSSINFPLDGYQYPNIRTIAQGLDSDSLWIQGHAFCTQYVNSMVNFHNQTDALAIDQATRSWYLGLWDKVFQGVFPKEQTNFFKAFELYDYANYVYNHGNSTQNRVSEADLKTLRDLAWQEQQMRNGDMRPSGLVPGDMIRTIGGRTLAAHVVSLFTKNVLQRGDRYKLNLAFTTFEPFLSFFALANLTGSASDSPVFKELPEPGAALIFELFTRGNETTYPSPNDLFVRFSYRNGVDDAIGEHELFRESEWALPYGRFASLVNKFDVNSERSWCEICDSGAFFCTGINTTPVSGSPGPVSNGHGSSSSKGLSPTVAGVVGAASAIAAMALVVLAAMFLGGVRFYRAGNGDQQKSSLGGFKGPEKMAGDADIEYAKNGLRRERTGSWELKSGDKDAMSEGVRSTVTPVPKETGAGITIQAPDLVRSPAFRGYDDDAASDLGVSPANPREF